MPLDDIRQRDAASPPPKPSPQLSTHNHHPVESFIYSTKPCFITAESVNLAINAQDAILDLCRQGGTVIQILFSTTFPPSSQACEKSDADAWEQVLPWLLNLRRNRIAVVFIAHAGRAGTMPAPPAAEDAAFWASNYPKPARVPIARPAQNSSPPSSKTATPPDRSARPWNGISTIVAPTALPGIEWKAPSSRNYSARQSSRPILGQRDCH